jgi:hypothetical protein
MFAITAPIAANKDVRLRPPLRTPQLRRGDHLHRLGDLLRRLDRGDPVFQII